jgi:hypothetical protein
VASQGLNYRSQRLHQPAAAQRLKSQEEPDSDAKQNKAKTSEVFFKPFLLSSASLGVLTNSHRLGEGKDFALSASQ